jgi:hypothetical protein
MIIRSVSKSFWEIDLDKLSLRFGRDRSSIEDYVIGNGFFYDSIDIYYSIGFTNVIETGLEEVSNYSVYGGLTSLQHSALSSYDQTLFCDAMRHDRNVSSRHFIFNCFIKCWKSLGGRDNFSHSDLKLDESYVDFEIDGKPLSEYSSYSIPEFFYHLGSHFASPTGIIDNLIPFIHPLHSRQLSLVSTREKIDDLPMYNWNIENRNHLVVSSFRLSYDGKHRFRLVDGNGYTYSLISDYLVKVKL